MKELAQLSLAQSKPKANLPTVVELQDKISQKVSSKYTPYKIPAFIRKLQAKNNTNLIMQTKTEWKICC